MTAFDEMGIASGETRPLYRQVARWLEETPPELLASRRAQAEYMFRRIGITFGVYGDKDAAERLIPFDIIPRLISRDEWNKLEKGITQRVTALNMFLTDVYGPGAILKEKLIPTELIPTQNPAGHILIACGTRPFRPDYVPFDGKTVFDSDEIIELPKLPRSSLRLPTAS